MKNDRLLVGEKKVVIICATVTLEFSNAPPESHTGRGVAVCVYMQILYRLIPTSGQGGILFKSQVLVSLFFS